jgi:DNA-directed RNA polymerase specialized sigma24 family protein
MLASQEPTPETATLHGEIASAVSEAAARLPRSLREVFNLYAISGLSLKNVAAATSLTLPATKTRLFRANTRMRSYLQPVWSDVRVRGAKLRSKAAGLAECNVSSAAA